ncbi:MAG: tetratricopeptide repeat protein [Calothrix sp. C42_A2020_038]|nr:tetratricopeptide repeat protein [Calothrix sp. C42_A2020_038]
MNKNTTESNVQSLIQAAVQKHQSGQLNEAESLYKQILQLQPEVANQDYQDYLLVAISNLGNIFEQQGKLDAACESYQQALSFKPDYAEAYYNLGNVFQKQGKLDQAVESYQQALTIRPEIAEAYNNLGGVFHKQGKLEGAVESYQKAISLKPNYAQAHYNLGNIFLQQGKLEAALKSYQDTLEIKPDHVQAYESLGNVYLQQGKLGAAVESYQQALKIAPNYAQAHHSLGNVFKLQGKFEAAIEAYQQAISFNPNYAEIHQNLGNTLYEQGYLEAAVNSYRQALKINPSLAPAKLGIVIGQLPIIYKNSTEIDSQRSSYQQHLVSLAQSYEQASPEELEKATNAVGSLQPFYLAYQGRNNRDLQQIYGEMIVKIMSSRYPQWSQPIPLPTLQSNEKIRIGFVSRFFYNHSNWKIPIQGWVENLDHSEFELFGYCTNDSKRDQETIKAATAFDNFTQNSLSLEQWCELIQKDKLHILIFPEFGMDPMTLKLGCLRLAPIQMTSWGHPDTSGLPTIDYYLSSDLMEPEKAQEHYTEQLVRLPNLSINYKPLTIQPQPISKEEIGVKNDETMFWCCQSLFKYLPQHDDVFPRITQGLNRRCKFVFIQYNKGTYVTEVFQQRLSNAFGEFGLNYQDHCIFLPALNSTRFAGITAIADVFLDSIAWSGCNSTLEAIAQNVPIVTLSGELMRGRHTMAILKMMGIEDTIATTKEDYVNIAIRLGRDAAFHQQIQKQVAENKYKLYGDLKPVRALEDFFLKILQRENRINQFQTDSFLVQKTNIQSLLDRAAEKKKLCRWDEVESLYKQVLEIQPSHIVVHNSLGELFQKQNRFEEAIAAYQKVLNLEPSSLVASIAHSNLGYVFQEQGKLEAALTSYQQALELDPKNITAYINLGLIFSEQVKTDASLKAYQQALNIQPEYATAKFGICINQLAIIYSSVDELELSRQNYQRYLQNLANHYQIATPEERLEAAKAVGVVQPFFLAYQGLNDRELQDIYGQMICQLMSSRYPQWSQPLALPKLEKNEKIRVGFVSRFFYNHSNWKIPLKGWIENLDRGEFELFGYHTSNERDQETASAAKSLDKFTQGLLPLEKWAEIIQQDKLHILIFPEFGMDPMTVKLGCLRLAPIQMTSWGHPNTSGLPTIDYYLSSDLMEPENAQEYYTEKLVRLPNLSIHYTPLAIQTQPTSKQAIGIADDEIMFWCCQSLYKYLPQHDDVFPQIAKDLPKCKFAFIEAPQGEYVTEVFRQRLKRTFEEFGLNYQDYCIFLPRLDIKLFAGTAAIADVFLDSISWSGCNSTLEALAQNIPVVTLAGDSMRGRHTMAILKMMGVEETIATTKADYVKIAIRLGKDAAYRQHIREQFVQNKQKLYGDLQPVKALEDLFFVVTNKPRRFSATEVAETLQLALQYHRANRFQEAEQLYHQVLEKQPDHPEALYNLGMLAQQFGQLDNAEKWLSAVSQIQPDVKTWFSLGNLRFAQGHYAQAVNAYRQALVLRPDALTIYNNLGYALQQQGLLDEAISSYQKALELKPDFIEADVNLGNALHAQGKLSSEQKLRYAQLNCKMGAARQKAGDLKTAVAYYNQAIALQPDLVDAHCQLGMALQAQGSLEEAKACYQRTLELSPNYSDFFNLALHKQQNLEESINIYRQRLELINTCYAKTVLNQGSEVSQGLPVTPTIPQTEVKIGNQLFPGIGLVQLEHERPFWSVVIPVYATQNRRQYLLQCLASVLMQWPGHQEMEILLIDDASTPPLYDLVNAIGGGIIRYYRNPQNMGAYRNFNIGVALSRGQWIHLLHDDDYVLPGFYDRLKQSLEGCPQSVGAAFTGYQNINEAGKPVSVQQAYVDRGIAHDFLQDIGVSNSLNMPAVVISRKVYEHLGGYLPELNYTGDWEFYKRIAAFYDWWCEPQILACYREHTDSITTESILSGYKGTCLRRAIEISEGYIPQEITAKSRSYHFDSCLKEVATRLKFGQVDGALRMVEEALKIDRSNEAMTKLLAWLKQDELGLLRDEITSKLISLPRA